MRGSSFVSSESFSISLCHVNNLARKTVKTGLISDFRLQARLVDLFEDLNEEACRP